MKRTTACLWGGLVLSVPFLCACETLLPIAGRILSTAVSNYNSDYGRLVEELGSALRVRPEVAPIKDASTTPLKLEVALLRQEDQGDEVVSVPMEDGAVLSHRGTLMDSDRFKIFFRPSSDCYVYVVLIDSTGFVQVLHPKSGRGERTGAGQGMLLPEGDMAYAVDQHVGIETIYFVAAAERRRDLEQVLTSFVGRTRPELTAPQTVQDLGDDLLLLGVAERSTGTVATVMQGGVQAKFATEAFLQVAGRDLVVTRWFEHR